MSALSTQLRDAIVTRLAAALGSSVRVFEYRGEFSKDAILRVAKRLPAVAVCCLGTASASSDPLAPTADYEMAAYVITKQTPSTKPLAKPGDAAAIIEQAILIEVVTKRFIDEADMGSNYRSVNMSGDAGPMGAGFGFIETRWRHNVELPPANADELTATLNDLETVSVDLDFADRAPDGSTAPDGVIDHTTTIEDLDA